MRLALLALTLIAAELPAQDTATARRPKSLCIQARNADRCEKYVITDLTLEMPFHWRSSRDSRGDRALPSTANENHIVFGIGMARNFDRRSIGAVSLFDLSTARWTGAELRFRHWLPKSNAALELSGGYARESFELFPSCQQQFTQRCVDPVGRGVRAGAAFVTGPHVTLFTHGAILRADGATHTVASAGASAHSTLAGIAALAGVVFLYVGYALMGT